MSGSKQSVILSDIKSSVSGRLRKVWRTLPKERQDSIKEVLHPATVAKIRRLLASTRDASKGIVVQEPVVTIGIALSRTDHKIEATLRSLISQKINALEILVIDSTNDRSIGEIVAEYCSRDGRIRSIKAENSSFDSACRLSEINSAAPYILFLSAGDIVSPNSIKTMYETVCTTRSDFVTGRPSLFKGKKATLPALQRRIYLETQLSASLQDIPVLLSDNFINNKIFSRQFWRSINTNDLTTGEYWSYEVLKRVYLSSSAFDIVSTDFVSTSNPNGGPALTRESLCELSTLDTFIMRIDSLDNYFRDRVSTDLYQQWITHEFGNGLFPHFEVLPRVGEEYWSRLHETVVKYCSVESINWGDLRLHNRIILSMVLAGSREDVETICVSRSDYGSSFPVTFNGSKMVANPQYLSHLATDVDSRLLLCNPVDLQMMAKMNHFVWLPEGELCVGGYAYVSGVDPSDPAFSVEVAVVDSDGVVLAQFDVVRGNDEQIDWNSNDNWTSYGASAFQAKINIKDVLDLATGGDKSELRVQVTLHLQDFKWVEFLSKRDTTGASGTLPVGPILGGQRLAVEFRPKTTGLTFFRLSPKIVANSVALTKRHLNLTVGSNNVSANTKLVIECKKLGIKKSVTPSVVGSDLLKFSLRLPELDATVSTRTEFQWQIRLVSKSGKSTPLAWKGDSGALAAAIDQTQSLSVSLTGYGFLTLTERKMRIFADEVIVAPDKRSITIHGTASLPVIQAPRFVLTSGKAIIAAESSILHLQYTDSSNRFTAKFLLPQTPWSSDELMPEPGAYSVRYVPRGSDDAAGYWIPASPALQSTMPYRLNAGRVEVGISRSPVTRAPDMLG